MTNRITVSRMLLLLGFVVLSGCSTNPVKQMHKEKAELITDVDLFIGSQALANQMSKVEINEIVYVHNTNGDIETEYRVVSEYTAASGNKCRVIRISGKSSGKDLICLSSDKWYWPPEIISE